MTDEPSGESKGPGSAPRKVSGERLRFMYYLLKRNPLSVVGLVVTALYILMAILAPLLIRYDPFTPDSASSLLPPSLTHWMGTDQLGMDVFSRVVYASRIDMAITVAGVAISLTVGVAIGAISGYLGGIADEVIMCFLDSQQAFPTYILAMALLTAIGQNLINIVIVLAVVNYPLYARLVRAQILSIKESYYADAARCLGCSPLRIVFKHLLPNCMGPVYVQAALNAGWALLLAAGLSFLGLGVRPPTPEWGTMINTGAKYLASGKWWMSLFPGAVVFSAVLGFNLLGDGLQDVFDPKRR